jgi:hypothetical protein
MKKPPAEIVASLLAVTTVIISLPPYHLPPWAIFIGWAGTFAAGGPSPISANLLYRVPSGTLATSTKTGTSRRGRRLGPIDVVLSEELERAGGRP